MRSGPGQPSKSGFDSVRHDNENELSRLRLALDKAIYSLEHIRERAERLDEMGDLANLAREAIDAVISTYAPTQSNVIHHTFGGDCWPIADQSGQRQVLSS